MQEIVHAPEKNAEKLTQVHVVRCLFKPQPTTVVQVHGKLCWEPLEKVPNSCYKGRKLHKYHGQPNLLLLRLGKRTKITVTFIS